jgi:hypothetical protein
MSASARSSATAIVGSAPPDPDRSSARAPRRQRVRTVGGHPGGAGHRLLRHASGLERQQLDEADPAVVEAPQHQERQIRSRGGGDGPRGHAPDAAPAVEPPEVPHRQAHPDDDGGEDQDVEQREGYEIRERGQGRLQRRVQPGRVEALDGGRREGGGGRDQGHSSERRRDDRRAE